MSKKNFLQAAFDDINFLITFWFDPCDAPMTAWLDALWPAAFNFFFDYLALDPKQIVRTRFKSSFALERGRTYRKGRKGRKSNRFRWFRRAGKIIGFDHNEFLGKKLWGWEEKTATKLTAKGTALFIFEGIVNRLAFWVWIIGLVEEFLMNWSSMMIKTTYCQAKYEAVLLAHGPDQTAIGIFGWHGLLFWTIDKQRGHVTWNGSAGSFNTLKGNFIVSSTVENVDPDPIRGVGIRVTITHPFAETQVLQEVIDIGVGQEAEVSVSGELIQGDHLSVECIVALGTGIFQTPRVYMHGSAGTSPPPPG